MRHELKVKDRALVGVSDLIVIAPIRPGFVPALDAVTYKTRVKRVLSSLHVGRSLSQEFDLARMLSDAIERVGRIHSVRIAVLEPENAVLLAVTFDGAWESYVRVIWQKVARLLDLIFCNTVDYVDGWTHGFVEWGRWLRHRQAETAFFFATPGVTVDDVRYLRMQERLARLEPAAGVRADRVAVPSTEAIAYQWFSDGSDPVNLGFDDGLDGAVEAQPEVFRQGLRSLVGLYRLADVYPPVHPDGLFLQRAARELLPDFLRLLTTDFLATAWDRAQDRYDEPLAWLTEPDPLPASRVVPLLPVGPSLGQLSAIQGGIIEPYPTNDHGVLLLLAFGSVDAAIAVLAGLPVTSAATQATLAPGDIATNIAFTVEGLRFLGMTDREVGTLPSEFAQGMERRAGVLGDHRINHPQRWRLPPRNWGDGIDAGDNDDGDAKERVPLAAVHALVQCRLLVRAEPVTARKRLLGALEGIVKLHPAVVPLSLQWMSRWRNAGGNVVEHFGFRDDVSEPVLRQADAGRFFSNQVHVGEAVIGRANAADAAPAPPPEDDWVGRLLHDGSFLVVRKLRQDVAQLEAVLERAAGEASATASGATLSREDWLGKMMGRYPDGHARAGEPLVGLQDAAANPNDFWYGGDPDGARCPFHAHIRRANPRAVVPSALQAEMGDGARPPRLFRRSMSYGPRFDAKSETGVAATKAPQRGIVFMAYNASIGEQFEVVQRWLTGGNSAGGFSGQSDPFVGLAEPGLERHFRFEHEGRTLRMALDGDRDRLAEPEPLVRLEWGGYFLTPSLPALALLLERAEAVRHGSTRVAWSVDEGRRAIRRLVDVERTQGAPAAKLAWKAALEDADAALDFTTASIWAAIREEHGGVLRTPYGVLLANKRLVDEALSNAPRALSSTGYLNRMRRSFGAIYLGLDAGLEDGQYESESQACNDAILRLSGPETFDLAFTTATNKIDHWVAEAKAHARADEALRRLAGRPPRTHVRWKLSLELGTLIDDLLATFCEQWFGLTPEDGFRRSGFRWTWKAGEPPCYPGHFMAPSRYIFQPHPEPAVQEIGAEHGAAMRAAMANFLAAKGASITAPVTRAVLDSVPGTRDPGLAARSLVGAMMGLVPTIDANLKRVLDGWLKEGTLWSLRAGRDLADPAATRPLVCDAFLRTMQSRAAPDTLWRTATGSHSFQGDSAQQAVDVGPGDIVVVGLAAAAQELLAQGLVDVSPAFGGDRRLVGHPAHACPGYGPAIAMMQGFVAALVECRWPLRAGPGPLTLALDEQDPVPDEGAGAETATGSLRLLSATAQWPPSPRFFAAAIAGGALEFHTKTPLWTFGDSWLVTLPAKLPCLIDALPENGYRVVNALGKRGLTLEAMTGGLDDLSRTLLDQTIVKAPIKALLFGGGGNDIVDPTARPQESWLFRLLKPGAKSAADALDGAGVDHFIDEVLAGDHRKILRVLVAATKVPILVHAYDYPIPNDRAATATLFGEKVKVSGPWLYPIFKARGMTELRENRQVMRMLIDRLNGMVATVASEFPGRVHHLDLRGTLDPDTDPDVWDNELHPSARGYKLIAAKIALKLDSLGVPPQD